MVTNSNISKLAKHFACLSLIPILCDSTPLLLLLVQYKYYKLYHYILQQPQLPLGIEPMSHSPSPSPGSRSRSHTKTRTPTINPSISPTKQITKLYYPPPHEKQFIIYSLVQKQSGLGVKDHQRFLVFDSFGKSLRYFSNVPIPLPTASLEKELAEGKETVYIAKVRNFQFKASNTEIGRAIAKWDDMNGSKKNWFIKFHNNAIMNQWVITVNQAKRNGHLQAQNRPKVVYQQPKKKIQKYETQFMKQTGGISSRRSSASKSQLLNSSFSQNKNNQFWIQNQIKQKQQQINSNHKKIHNIQSSQKPIERPDEKSSLKAIPSSQPSTLQSPNPSSTFSYSAPIPASSPAPPLTQPAPKSHFQAQPPKKFANLPQDIPSIEQAEDESKFSKRSELELNNSQSTKNFRINRLIPQKIVEDSQQIQQSNLRNVQQRLKYNQENLNLSLSQNQNLRSSEITSREQELNMNLFLMELRKQGSGNFYQRKRETEIRKNGNEGQNGNQEDDYGNFAKFYPYYYSQFIRKCEEYCYEIIQNMAVFLDKAEKKPSNQIFLTSKQLIIVKNSIQLVISLSQPKQSDLFQPSLKMQQNSSIFSYITRKFNSKPPNSHNLSKYQTILPIPYCIITYKWYQVKCKAVFPPSKKLTQRQKISSLDTFFQLPLNIWQYFQLPCSSPSLSDPSQFSPSDSLSILFIDPNPPNLSIISNPSPSLLTLICQFFVKQPYLSHFQDFSSYCQSHFKITVTTQIIYQFIEILYKKFNIQLTNPINRVLFGVLYGIKIGEKIRGELRGKMGALGHIRALEVLEQFVKGYRVNLGKNGGKEEEGRYGEGDGIWEQIRGQLRRRGVVEKREWMGRKEKETKGLVNQFAVYSSLIQLLGLQIATNGRKDQNQSLKFKITSYGFNVQCMCPQMREIGEILRNIQLENLSQEKRYQSYLRMKQVLEIYDQLWEQNQQIRTKGDSYRYSDPLISKKRKTYSPSAFISKKLQYFNNYQRIFYYLSLYLSYVPVFLSQSSIPSDSSFYALQLEQIQTFQPLSYLSVLISINCIKWLTKSPQFSPSASSPLSTVFSTTKNLFLKNFGYFSTPILLLFQLFQIYNEKLFNYKLSIQYARYSLEIVIEMYGDRSPETMEKWFVLGCLLNDSENYDEALEGFARAIQGIGVGEKGEETGMAELTIRSKVMKIYLFLGKIQECIKQCSLALLTCQSLSTQIPHIELDILNTIIKCYLLTNQSSKLEIILETTSLRFGNRQQLSVPQSQQIPLSPSLTHSIHLSEPELLRQQMLKICLSPAIKIRIKDKDTLQFLCKLTKNIRNRYENRYNKKEYHCYLTEWMQGYVNGNENPKQNKKHEKPQINLLQTILLFFQKVQVYSNPIKNDRNFRKNYTINSEQIKYNLYQNENGSNSYGSVHGNGNSGFGNRIQPATQNKIIVQTMRIIETLGGILGYGYLEGSFL